MYWSGSDFIATEPLPLPLTFRVNLSVLFYLDETRCWIILFWCHWQYEEADQGNVATSTTTISDNIRNNVLDSVVLAKSHGTTVHL